MSVGYERVMRSPHLSEQVHGLARRYLSPAELQEGLKTLVEVAEASLSGERRLRVHELGRSQLGAPLIGWTLGDPRQPRLLCASQHHGPENYGASFSLFCSHLLLSDPLFQPLLERFSVSFFPQQNPDALTAWGNMSWMEAPTWRGFVEGYQYDPRRLDVEHGVPPEWLPLGEVGSRERLRRAESEALTRWVASEVKAYGAPLHYQSGHAWGLLDAPLYLMYPNLGLEHPSHPSWSSAVERFNRSAPYKQLACAAPLNDDYELPRWPQEPLNGFYVLPTRAAFLKRNPQSEVMCSSMDVVAAHAPEARILVIEPPIFTSEQAQGGHEIDFADLTRLKEAAALHQRAVERLDELWRGGLEAELGGEPLERAYFSEDARRRSLARLRLESRERMGVGARWERLVEELMSREQISPCELRSGHLKLAVMDQHFSAANLLSLGLRLGSASAPDPTLQRLYEGALEGLSGAELTPWEVEWGVGVYLAPLLATMSDQGSLTI